MKKKTKFIVGSLTVVAAMAYLVVTGISKTAVYYLTVGELVKSADSLYGEGIRVEGKVVPGSIKKSKNMLKMQFKMSDGIKVISVDYEGIVPDMFDEDRKVVVEGTFLSTGEVKAKTIMTSCPSKYEAETSG